MHVSEKSLNTNGLISKSKKSQNTKSLIRKLKFLKFEIQKTETQI